MNTSTFATFNPTDPFEEELTASTAKVQLRLRQRSGRKALTLIEGLDEDLDLAAICKALKKALACNGSILEGRILQLSGDQRAAAVHFLVENSACTRDRIVI